MRKKKILITDPLLHSFKIKFFFSWKKEYLLVKDVVYVLKKIFLTFPFIIKQKLVESK